MSLNADQLIPLSYVEKTYRLKPNSPNNGKWWKVISMQIVLTNAFHISCLLCGSKLLCLTLIELRPKLSFNLVALWSIFMGNWFNWLLLHSVGLNRRYEYGKDISPSITSFSLPPPPSLKAIKQSVVHSLLHSVIRTGRWKDYRITWKNCMFYTTIIL